MVRFLHTALLNREDGGVHIATAAVEIRRMHMDNQWLTADMLCEYTRRIGQPIMAVDDVEIQTVRQHTRYRFVVTDLLNQVIRITARETDASEVIRTDTAVVIMNAVAEMIELLRTHLSLHAGFDVVVVHILPDDRYTVRTNDAQERLIFVTPRFRNNERNLHVRLLRHAARQAVTGGSQTS